MSHCPQCGETPPEGARACPFCGTQLAATARAAPAASRTIVGVSAHEVAASLPRASNDGVASAEPAGPVPLAPPAGASKANHTIVGMPVRSPAGRGSPSRPAAEAPGGDPRPAPREAGRPAPSAVGRTIVGMAAGAPRIHEASSGPDGSGQPVPIAKPAGAPGAAASATLLGVARPGIAPLAPGEGDAEPEAPEDALPGEEDGAPDPADADPPGYQPARELGATIGPGAAADRVVAKVREQDRDRRRRRALPVPAQKPAAKAARRDERRASQRTLAIVFTAGGLALAAVLVALFWPSAPPLSARARADAAGREGVELVCKSCPDGTRITISGASATTTGGVALVVLPTALSVGENRLKVAIDRPGAGRDETVSLTVNVGYRIRPDLGTLQADRPSFQILAEVAEGTTVRIDGRDMAISGGHGVENVDVTEACTGLSSEVKTLSKQIPYVVTPKDGKGVPEQGVVNVSVGIVPLHLDAPVAVGSSMPHVVTDGPSFVLAGSTMKGAEVLAAGRPITVHPDGRFAQVMNVSSVGATQIEVRAKVAGMAPRLSQIKVRRVESLEKAAREFASSESPVPFAQVAANIPGAVGRAVVLSGEVSEAKKQDYETVMLLEVSGCSGVGSCTVRLVQGADNPAKRGDTLRVFGHVARAFQVPGRADIPEIEVDFTLKGDAQKGDGGASAVKERR